MKTVDTIIIPQWIVPIEPHNVFLTHHAIAIDKSKIIAVMPTLEMEAAYQAKETIHLNHHVVMPGLINAHTHSPMTLFRGYADDLTLMDWLENYIWPIEKKFLFDDFVYDGTLLAIAEMLKSGTTCFNENYFFAESIFKAADKAKIRAMISETIIDFSSNYAKTPDEYLEKTEQLCLKYPKHPLIHFGIAPHAPYSVSDDTFKKIKLLADKYHLPIHLHLHETADEIKQSLAQYGKRPIERMQDLGILSEHTQCIHMTQITEKDISILQKTKAHVVHCPESNLKLASGFCPVKKLMDAAINIALGTDGAASNNDLDMFGEMHTAALLSKAESKNPTALNAAEVLRMATLNGAKALGLENKIGSIETGKEADIISIDLSAPNTQPVYNPISHLAYCTNSYQVSDVWVAGKQLVKKRELTTIDSKEIFEKTSQWRKKIKIALVIPRPRIVVRGRL